MFLVFFRHKKKRQLRLKGLRMKRTMMFAAVMSVVVTFAAVTAMSANAVSLTGQNKPVTIRRASSSPFEDGKRVESVWSRADTLSGFVVPGCMDAAIDDAHLFIFTAV